MTKLEKILIAYANNVIDSRCEWEGPNEVLQDLVNFGFTKDVLTEMGFDIDAVDTVLENNEENE